MPRSAPDGLFSSILFRYSVPDSNRKSSTHCTVHGENAHTLSLSSSGHQFQKSLRKFLSPLPDPGSEGH